MRISWGRIYAGQWPAFEEAFKGAADAPVEGLLARWMVQDSQDRDAVFGVTIWDRRESIEKWIVSDDYTHRYRPALSPFLLGSFSTSVCDVKYTRLAMPLSTLLADQGDRDA